MVETLAAARILANKLGVPIGAAEKLTLREFLDRWLGIPKEHVLGISSQKKGLIEIQKSLDVLKLVDSDGSDGAEIGLTLDEMIGLSGMTPQDFKDLYFFLDGMQYSSQYSYFYS